MSSFHQMGDKSENLLYELDGYAGAILSPVNYDQGKLALQVAKAHEEKSLEMIFDPQLYVPQSQRGFLQNWSYFPKDVDSADLSSNGWWSELLKLLSKTFQDVKADSICSPAILPKKFTDEFYSSCVSTGNKLVRILDKKIVFQTAIVSLQDLEEKDRSLAVAGILSQTDAERIYLVFMSDMIPRREYNQVEQLKGGMKLISALEKSGLNVLVGFCSSESVLWKSAGASACATGKFFNLRRFTRSRFDEPNKGGGQLPYWFEQSLFGFLRETDLLRIQAQGLLSSASLSNPFGTEILNMLSTQPGTPWVGIGWRQFMHWFSVTSASIDSGTIKLDAELKAAEQNWLALEDRKVLLDEPRNDGSWIRSWRRALAEYAT